TQLDKNRTPYNISSQQDSIRSCININNIHEQAVQGAERHCVERKVLLMLWGPGDWENKLQDLKDSVVWAYMDLVKGTWKGIIKDTISTNIVSKQHF
ncbi:hypothetical protein V5O48_010494, partial [Marasmius crinis-equi]